MRAASTAFQGHFVAIYGTSCGVFVSRQARVFGYPQTARKSRYSTGVRGVRASRKRRPAVQDEAFSTCTSCGSDEIVSASRLLERGRISLKCSQCGARFTATSKEAMTITGTPLREVVEAAKEENSDEEEDRKKVGVKLYIAGLPPRVDSTALRRAIEEFAEVTDCRVVMDRVTGRSRGFGFVTVRGRSTAAAVIDILNGDSRRLGSRLTVREAIE